jgi:hypothetical protein
VCSLTKLITTADSSPLTRRVFCRAGIAAAALPGLFAGNGFAQDGTISGTAPNGLATTGTAKADGKTPKKLEPKELTAEEKEAARKKAAAEEEKNRKPLFIAKEFPKGWHYHPAEGGIPLEDSWKVGQDQGKAEPYLRCLGKPYGYLRTKDIFDNYEFKMKWRYPADPNGNSGILLHTSGKDQIWPSSIQVQLHRPKIGHVFASGDAKADNQLTGKIQPRELNVWNECVVTCRDGRIIVEINKKKVGELTGCTPNKGMIGLQSEGSEIHFQSLSLRKLPASS